MSRFAKTQAVQSWPSYERAEEILSLLSGFRGYPREDRGRRLFVEALMRCQSAEHANAALRLIRGRFPTLEEIDDVISRTRLEFVKAHNPNPECERCSGTGFEIVKGRESDGARRCGCWGEFPRHEEFRPTKEQNRCRVITVDAPMQAILEAVAEKQSRLRLPKDQRPGDKRAS